MHDETVTIDEAARLAHVSRGTIQYWLRTGRLAVDHVPPRSEWSERVRPGAKKPYGIRVRRADVLAATFQQRAQSLKLEHSDLNLLTVRELAGVLSRGEEWARAIVRRFELKKYYVDRWSYMVSGAELWEKAQESPHYAQLFLKL